MSIGSFDHRLAMPGFPGGMTPLCGGGSDSRNSLSSTGSSPGTSPRVRCNALGACLERSLEGGNSGELGLDTSGSFSPGGFSSSPYGGGGPGAVFTGAPRFPSSGSPGSPTPSTLERHGHGQAALHESMDVGDIDVTGMTGGFPVDVKQERYGGGGHPEDECSSHLSRNANAAGDGMVNFFTRQLANRAIRKTDGEVCFGCGNSITEKYLLKVSDRAWHMTCLRCCVCQTTLDRQSSCFFKDENIYCKNDYSREFGTKCSKCLRHIQSTDWVRRAKNNVYHLACFSCDSCKRQLSTGEEFALQDSRVLCKTHYVELIEGGSNTDEFGEFSADEGGSAKQKTKRVRTTFTEEQLQVLQANFQLDSNPDGQDLERIAQITGLSKRVTQVWFQNSRARQKKHQQTAHNRINSINNLSTSMSSAMSITTSMSSPSPSGESMYHQPLSMSPLKSVYVDA